MARNMELAEVNGKGVYVAKSDIPTSENTIIHRGRPNTKCLSKYKLSFNGMVLDGTSRAKDFQSAWRLRCDQDSNMVLKTVAAPMVCVSFDGGSEADGLGDFYTPAAINNKYVKKGEELVMEADRARMKPAQLA